MIEQYVKKTIIGLGIFITFIYFIYMLANVENPKYKITYEVGGASRTYIVKQHAVGENGCVSFYDEVGYKHTICGTYEIETVK